MNSRRLGLLGEVARYAVVGVGNVALDFGILGILIHLTGITAGPWLIVFATIGFLCAVMNGYYWNGQWTFRVALNPRRQFIPFAAVQTVGLVLNDLVLVIAMRLLAFQTVHPFVRVYEAKVAAIIIVAVWNFTASRSLVFRAPRAASTEPLNTELRGIV